MEKNPKAFISHATKDQKRFVRKFAEKLQANGVETWYSEWSLSMGDSLIDKISDEGISKSDVVIVIISKNSINSNWVKQELNWSLIDFINEKCRLFPIAIDSEVKFPDSLRDTFHKRIKDINNYDEEFNDLLCDIFGKSRKPKLGEKPKFLSITPFEDLEIEDTLILSELGVFFKGEYSCHNISWERFKELISSYNFSDELILSSLDFLRIKGYVEFRLTTDSHIPKEVKLTYSGLFFYLIHESNFDEIEKEVIIALYNEKLTENLVISKEININLSIINCFLIIYKNNDILQIVGPSTDNRIRVSKITPYGLRYFRKNLI